MNSSPIVFPAMGCGTWAWGNQVLWGYDASMDGELQQVFDRCVASGVTFFDTGDSYGTGKLKGKSEQLLGQFSQNYSAENANEICLATKLAPYPWRLTSGSIVQAGRASIDRMGRIDLVQLHWSTGNYAPWLEGSLLDGLAELYEQGLVRGVGLSNFGPKRLKLAYERLRSRGIPILSLQVQYSLLSTYPVTELGLKELCDELGIKMIAYSPLCLGLLTGKYDVKGPFPKGLRSFLFPQLLPKITGLLDCLNDIASQREKTISQIALNWCICKGIMPIPGAKSLVQADQNIGALGWSLDDGEVDALDKAAAGCDRKMIQNIFQSR
ncbi:MAG: aldo/keto reductase [Alkalinema sp. CAN_BIN05]|nr:aldo/keto reductase [Alkalinema sp. CAN_BIN05]